MKVETLVVGQMATNCYIFADNGYGVIIDPGDDAEYISDTLTRLSVKPIMIIATHGHFDHIMAAFAIQKIYDIPFTMHKDDEFLLANMQKNARHFLGLPSVDPPPKVTKYLKGKDCIKVGSQTAVVVHTPGHTPGSVCLYIKDAGVLFVGDTIFAGGVVGRTDFSYSDQQKFSESLKTILSYPASTRILSGHGEESTVFSQKHQ